MGLGVARDLHRKAYEKVRLGIDPIDERKAERVTDIQAVAAARNVPLFRDVAMRWYEWWRPRKNTTYQADVWTRLENDIFPAIGHLPVDSITSKQIVDLCKAVEGRGARDIACRCLQQCKWIFAYGNTHEGLRVFSPAGDIKPGQIFQPKVVKNFARVETEDFPQLLRDIERMQGLPTTMIAIKLMALTFVRTGSMLQAEWTEIDWDAHRWIVPKEHMKQIKGAVVMQDHIVPLAKQTMALLETLHELTGDSPAACCSRIAQIATARPPWARTR